MVRRTSASFRFEKSRLLHRGRTAEYWEGVVAGRPALIKRFAGNHESCRREYSLMSRIRHSVLLPAWQGGVGPGGRYAYSMMLDFVPSRVNQPADPVRFAVQALSLFLSLRRAGVCFRWDPQFLLEDRLTGRVYVPGISPVAQKPDADQQEDEARRLAQIREALGESPAMGDLEKILRKWERRKENVVDGCLGDILQRFGTPPELLPAWFEMPRARELELVGGLLQLVRQMRGRAVLFQSDPGGGKSTLISQIYRDLLQREAVVVPYQSPPETRPFYSIRNLMDAFLEQTHAYQAFRSGFSAGRWTGSLQDSLDVPEEALVADLLGLVEKLRADTDRAFVFLVDDLDGFDRQSMNVMARVMRNIQSSPVLLIATATRKMDDLPDPLVVLPLETLPVGAFEASCRTPLWKPDQQKSVIHSVYGQTSGNMALFHEVFQETLRRCNATIRWEAGEWSFGALESPVVPDSAASLYLSKASDLSPGETRFLESASVQGCVFDPRLVEQDVAARKELLNSLREKGIVAQTGESTRFLRPVLAYYFYDRMEGERKKELHLLLAGALSCEDSRRQQAEISRHFLRAGRLDEALEHACRASRQIRFNTAQVVLPILEELERSVGKLDAPQKFRLHKEKAEVLFRWGRYPAAAESFRKAISIAGDDPAIRFDLRVRVAECLYLFNDIHGAVHALQDAEPLLHSVRDPALLIRFYFCRGACGWQRGSRDRNDFEKALALAEESQDYEALASGHRQLAALELRGGALMESRALAAKAMRFARKTGSYVESGHALRILGMIAWHRSLHNTAGRIFQRSIRHFSRAGSMDGVARVWSLLGNVDAERYRFREAIAAFQKASALFGQLDHPLEVSLAQFNLGLVYIEQGRLKEAEKIYLRCKSIDRKTGNKRYYAYDLRALAVVAILRGFHRKASALLQRTLEIYTELRADGDILQTRMIQLMNELEQKNYRQAQPIVEILREQLEGIHEPMARAEVHYLLGHYHGYINETERALKYLQEALRLARKIRYFKLMGMCLVLKLVFSNTVPGRKDQDLSRAISCFRRSHNDLRRSDYLLKLYQAYPVLLKEREHAAWLVTMEKLYRQIRHRAKHRIVRQLAVGQGSRKAAPDPLYEWWQSVLQSIHGEGDLETRIQNALGLLSEELHASAAGLWFRDSTLVRFHFPAAAHQDAGDGFHETIWKRLAARKESLCAEVCDDPELAGHPWIQLHDVRSVMAVPLLQENRVLGMWYFERSGAEPSFVRKDVGKAAFFSTASQPVIVSAIQTGAAAAQEPAGAARIDSDFVGKSGVMQALQRQIGRLAPLDISVLILGESGTGKELIARSLHRNSPRASGPFQALNCSAIPESLVESELFGYAKGAFTGASMTKQGYIERAHGGTLFLDEVGDLSSAAQAKLLRVMQEKEIQRVGETTPRRVDVRFLFATHKDLKKMVREGGYRQDLFYRISVYTLSVPPLRDRPEDIPLLLSHFTEKYARAFSRGKIQYSPAAMQALCDYSWPGNVREMENAVQTLLVNVDSGGRVDLKDLPPQITAGASIAAQSGVTLEEARQEFEREFLKQALKRNSWNKTQTARELGITRQGLMQMIQRLGISER